MLTHGRAANFLNTPRMSERWRDGWGIPGQTDLRIRPQPAHVGGEGNALISLPLSCNISEIKVDNDTKHGIPLPASILHMMSKDQVGVQIIDRLHPEPGVASRTRGSAGRLELPEETLRREAGKWGNPQWLQTGRPRSNRAPLLERSEPLAEAKRGCFLTGDSQVRYVWL